MSTPVALSATEIMMDPIKLQAVMGYCDMLAKSTFVPKDYQNNPGNVLVAIQWGNEVGLQPLQAMQNIAVVNGRPSLWGDAVLALVMGSGVCDDISETFDENTLTASCEVKRKGKTPINRTFSKADADKANLWTKAGTWQQYPKRMLQMRARAWALRDAFPDVLKGMPIAEEIQDIDSEPLVETQTTSIAALNSFEKIQKELEALGVTVAYSNGIAIAGGKTSQNANVLKTMGFKFADGVFSCPCSEPIKTLENQASTQNTTKPKSIQKDLLDNPVINSMDALVLYAEELGLTLSEPFMMAGANYVGIPAGNLEGLDDKLKAVGFTQSPQGKWIRPIADLTK